MEEAILHQNEELSCPTQANLDNLLLWPRLRLGNMVYQRASQLFKCFLFFQSCSGRLLNTSANLLFHIWKHKRKTCSRKKAGLELLLPGILPASTIKEGSRTQQQHCSQNKRIKVMQELTQQWNKLTIPPLQWQSNNRIEIKLQSG